MDKKQALQEIGKWYGTELLPCPFCGDEVDAKPMVSYINNKHDPEMHFTVECTNCGCEPDYCIYTAQEAINIWNHRAVMPKTEDALIGFEIARSQIIKLIDNMKKPWEKGNEKKD